MKNIESAIYYNHDWTNGNATRTAEHRNGSLQIKQLELQGWNINYSEQEHRLPPEVVQQGKDVLDRWVHSFPDENTWARRTLGIPSLIARLDATVQDGQLHTYEVEERPAGIGIGTLLNAEFRHKLEEVKKTWPHVEAVISSDPRRRGTDDHLWLPVAMKETARGLVLVRAEPEETEFHELEERSISSLKRKGDKSYGERMGLWSRVTDAEALPWNTAFVLKPLQGSKTRDVFIWIPKDQQPNYLVPGTTKPPGAVTRTKITEAMTGKEAMYCQPFVSPVETGFAPEDRHRWLAYRVFYGYDTKKEQWTYLGGVWNARDNLKIHGAGDTLFGPTN